ncbi:MAG TPA: RusA family crossover junction endodeoxyribonuclease [Solirubrobacter sp.]|nr:RusA family crossover junction endodeoxyribonuclease [Solirubrobacter sp.]
MIELRVDGPPTGKGRPRFNTKTGKTYTPASTVQAEGRIKGAFLEARGRLIEGPVTLEVEAAFKRPENHWRKSGDLSASGLRSAWPSRTPDVDNILKLASDALNRLAFTDDALIAHAWVVKRWCNPGEVEHTLIRVRPMPAPLRAVAA